MGLTPNFDAMVKEVAAYDAAREALIKQGRVVLKVAKQLIYSVHRDDLTEAKQKRADLEKERAKLDKLANHNKRMALEGSYSEAIQEYVEAVVFFEYVTKQAFTSKTKLKVTTMDYLLGMCDFTGELTRRAVLQATKQNYVEVAKIHDLVDKINGEFLKFDLRNSPLRKKYDQIKWNISKIQEISYDVSKRTQ